MLVRFRTLKNIKIQEGETQRKYKKIENLILPSPQTTIELNSKQNFPQIK